MDGHRLTRDTVFALVATTVLAFVAWGCSSPVPSPPPSFDCRGAVHDLNDRIDHMEGKIIDLPPQRAGWQI